MKGQLRKSHLEGTMKSFYELRCSCGRCGCVCQNCSCSSSSTYEGTTNSTYSTTQSYRLSDYFTTYGAMG